MNLKLSIVFRNDLKPSKSYFLLATPDSINGLVIPQIIPTINKPIIYIIIIY